MGLYNVRGCNMTLVTSRVVNKLPWRHIAIGWTGRTLRGWDGGWGCWKLALIQPQSYASQFTLSSSALLGQSNGGGRGGGGGGVVVGAPLPVLQPPL